MHDEELRACGIGHYGARHRKHALGVFEVVFEAVGGEFTLDVVAGTAHAGAVRAAALDHKAVDNAVKGQPVIKAAARKAKEISHGVGRDLGVQLSLDDLAAFHFYCYDWVFHWNHSFLILLSKYVEYRRYARGYQNDYHADKLHEQIEYAYCYAGDGEHLAHGIVL